MLTVAFQVDVFGPVLSRRVDPESNWAITTLVDVLSQLGADKLTGGTSFSARLVAQYI